MKFLSTWYGSYLKVFITTVLAMWMAELTQGYDMFSMDLIMFKKLFSGGIVAVLPIIINAMNPHDNRYGKRNEKL